MTFIDDISSSLSFLTDNKYVYAVAVFIFSLILIKCLLYIAKKILTKVVKKTETDVDDIILERAENPIVYTLVIVALRICLNIMPMPDDFSQFLNNLMDSLIIIFVAYAIHVATSVILEHYIKKINKRTVSSFHSEIIPFTNNFSKVIYAVIACVFILWIWGVNVVPLLAGLGIAGITIGLALQSTLSNIISGIAILLDKNFNIGDEIKIDDVEGTVIDVGLRSTKIRTKNNEMIIVPNGLLANAKITNFAKPNTHLRIGVEFTTKTGVSLEKLIKNVESRVKNITFLEHHKPEITIMSITDEQLKITMYFWIDLQRVGRNIAREQLTEIVYDTLKKAR